MKEYDGFELNFGTHTIRVHLQEGSYKGYFDTRVRGNCKGIDVLNFDFEDDDIDHAEFYNCEIKYYEGYDCYGIKLYDEIHDDWLEDELAPNEMGALIVGIEIVDFREE